MTYYYKNSKSKLKTNKFHCFHLESEVKHLNLRFIMENKTINNSNTWMRNVVNWV